MPEKMSHSVMPQVQTLENCSSKHIEPMQFYPRRTHRSSSTSLYCNTSLSTLTHHSIVFPNHPSVARKCRPLFLTWQSTPRWKQQPPRSGNLQRNLHNRANHRPATSTRSNAIVGTNDLRRSSTCITQTFLICSLWVNAAALINDVKSTLSSTNKIQTQTLAISLPNLHHAKHLHDLFTKCNCICTWIVIAKPINCWQNWSATAICKRIGAYTKAQGK